MNEFVDAIYLELQTSGNVGIRKKHLKVVLLDLYVNWCSDPALRTAYSRNTNDYSANSIYNELSISRTTIQVVDWLVAAGYLDTKHGFKDWAKNFGVVSRMWPTHKLTDEFKAASFSAYDVSNSSDRLTVVLTDETGQKIEYVPTPETEAMDANLRSYNELLQRTFILPHSLENSRLPSSDSFPSFAMQRSKFTYRVFNRGSFNYGGRFYGPWWQNCPKTLRNDILIDDQISIEVDYSSIHPNLLYAKQGLDMWAVLEDDPYTIETVSFTDDPEDLRFLSKQLMLIMLNANTPASVPAAFRDNQQTGSNWKKLTNQQIQEITSQLIAIHAPIAAHFGAGEALHLQNQDANIAAIIINHFTKLGVLVLSIHDSFIVQQGWEEELETIMDIAFKEVTKTQMASRLKYVGLTYNDVLNELYERYNIRHGKTSQTRTKTTLYSMQK